jgi:hypothetical protein
MLCAVVVQFCAKNLGKLSINESNANWEDLCEVAEVEDGAQNPSRAKANHSLGRDSDVCVLSFHRHIESLQGSELDPMARGCESPSIFASETVMVSFGELLKWQLVADCRRRHRR